MPTTETRRLNPVVLWGMVLAVIVLLVVSIRAFTRDIVEVRVAAVNHQNLLSTVATNGRVEPVEYYQAHAPAAGIVAKVYVEVGQKVKIGDPLVKMDDAEPAARLATATAALRSAELNLQNTKQNGSQEERLALS
ncbi:MAG TPA: biotin/lipoyl-binding protein, partial [Edaphobacter sp.]|nr:biotin/lipoyl-binding protein [Edaphobacter sp.]